MGLGLFGIGVSGLNAAQAGIRTTEHNISNVNTAGYRRQEVQYTASSSQFTAGSMFGGGVSVDSVRNLYSQFLDNEVMLDQTRLSRQEAYTQMSSRVDGLLGDTRSALSGAINGFFDAADEVANDPTSSPARKVLLAAGQTLADRTRSMSATLSQMNEDTNNELSALTNSINGYSSQIASLNLSIDRIEVSGGLRANDLRDQRSQLVSELNKLINVTPVEQDNGDFSVFIGGAQALVNGSRSYQMSTTPDANDPRLDVPAMLLGNTTQTLSPSMITGGEISGLMAQREEVLIPALDGINRIAVAIGNEVNRVQRAGLDSSMAPGQDLFSSVVEQTSGNSWIDLGLTSGSLPNQNFAVSFDGTNYTIARTPASGTAIPPVAPGNEVFDAEGNSMGFRISAGTPTPVAGHTWQLNFGNYAADMTVQLSQTGQVAAAASDADGPGNNVNAQALAALRLTGTLDDGTTSFSGAYTQLTGSTAALASEADLSRTAYEALVKQATEAQQSISGVNLDEEAVNLIRFQQAYQAAARAISIANGLFDEVIGLAR